MAKVSLEKQREYKKRYLSKPGKQAMQNGYNKKYAQTKPDRRDATFRKVRYGLTQADYNRMFQKQGGRCAICGVHQSELTRALAVDHNHQTGEVRGLLCGRCNLGIGHMRDDPNLLCSAIRYLEGGR